MDNLSYDVTEDDLHQAFGQFGQVETVTINKGKPSGKSKGFGFVEMPSDTEGQSAMEGLNGKELKGKKLNLNLPRTPKSSDSTGAKDGFAGAKGGFHSKGSFAGGKMSNRGGKGAFQGNKGGKGGKIGGKGGNRGG